VRPGLRICHQRCRGRTAPGGRRRQRGQAQRAVDAVAAGKGIVLTGRRWHPDRFASGRAQALPARSARQRRKRRCQRHAQPQPQGGSWDVQDWPPRDTTEQRFRLFLLQQHSRATCLRQLLSCAQSLCCLPPSQPGERSTSFRESPAKMPTACSGHVSDLLPFLPSPLSL